MSPRTPGDSWRWAVGRQGSQSVRQEVVAVASPDPGGCLVGGSSAFTTVSGTTDRRCHGLYGWTG